ncbi:TatD DNase family protein [Moraxella cuniculi DSM 21768]|uniref:TatD DNase family protein n=1 Tax=Moraxella cuniculi DSM 21768 TaxID=1122245 RepID=A0A1N7EST0_9GAMM|nr:TatD family hydrolase [Moraxella cuniculi]OOS06324.1 TatD family deoxyribonuclease [Moraxella cuniculi]SIR91084.1 TatD DNase family protein [Moraxella cuniculi DSM 21768]
MSFTDSHAHLTYLTLDNHNNQPQALLDAMSHAGVGRVMAIMCQLSENQAIREWVDLASQNQSMPDIGMSVGIHPCQDEAVLAAVCVDDLLALDGDKVWAFGETGLDYYWDENKSKAQKHSFATHIAASKIAKKPIVVHTRNAYQDTLDVLKSENCEHGIIHCFTEDYAFARQALDGGLYISLSGIISFNKSQDLREVVAKLPLDRLLIETDSPYLAPVPKRGKQNEPTFVPYVAQVLAKIFDKTPEEIGQITSDNFIRLVNQYKNII